MKSQCLASLMLCKSTQIYGKFICGLPQRKKPNLTGKIDTISKQHRDIGITRQIEILKRQSLSIINHISFLWPASRRVAFDAIIRGIQHLLVSRTSRDEGLVHDDYL